MIHGDPGTGKSVPMRLLAERLARLPDVTVGAIAHPQSNLADFYREMGDIFGVPMRPHNRRGGFKALREACFAHLETTRRRAVLLIDEAQEMSPAVLSELRLTASARFDSRSLLCVVLVGDMRLPEKLRREGLGTAGLTHPYPARDRAGYTRGAARLLAASAQRRRQRQPDEDRAPANPVRSRLGQLSPAHDDDFRAARSRRTARAAATR